MATINRQRLLPSTNDPRLVTRLCEMVAQGVRSTRGLQEALGIELRSVQHVAHAAEWLGLLETEGESLLTPLGLEYVYAGRQRWRVWDRAVWQHPWVDELMAGRSSLPTDAEIAAAIGRVEPEVGPTTLYRRATALRGLLGPAIGRGRPRSEAERQLDLPFVSATGEPEPPRLELSAGREYNPDVYRYLLCSLLDHGELSLGQVRALLDRAGVSEAPIGGYVDLALARGDAARVDERLVASREGVARRALSETTASIVLSDPAYRAYLADLRAAARGDRQAEIRRDRVRGRFRIWDRRLFGREIEPSRIEVELRRVLMDRSLESYPAANGPGAPPIAVEEPFLDAWERSELPIALPPSLANLRGGLASVNAALKTARQGSHDVSLPGVAHRPTRFHAGLVHPGEPLPRTVPDLRSLRLRLLVHAPYPALVAAVLLAHRTSGGRYEVIQRRAGFHVRGRSGQLGELLELVDGFAAHRGWLVARRPHGGLPAPTLLEVLGIAGVVERVGHRAVLSDRFFAQLRSEAEEIEIHQRLLSLAQAVEAWLDTVEPIEAA